MLLLSLIRTKIDWRKRLMLWKTIGGEVRPA
jgi:hypothetical protein